MGKKLLWCSLTRKQTRFIKYSQQQTESSWTNIKKPSTHLSTTCKIRSHKNVTNQDQQKLTSIVSPITIFIQFKISELIQQRTETHMQTSCTVHFSQQSGQYELVPTMAAHVGCIVTIQFQSKQSQKTDTSMHSEDLECINITGQLLFNLMSKRYLLYFCV